MTNTCLVRCANYNGHKNVLFMCEDNDSRIGKLLEIIVPAKNCKFDSKKEIFQANDDMYKVFSDWSVKLITNYNNYTIDEIEQLFHQIPKAQPNNWVCWMSSPDIVSNIVARIISTSNVNATIKVLSQKLNVSQNTLKFFTQGLKSGGYCPWPELRNNLTKLQVQWMEKPEIKKSVSMNQIPNSTKNVIWEPQSVDTSECYVDANGNFVVTKTTKRVIIYGSAEHQTMMQATFSNKLAK
jgi:hypothetical protein